MEAVKGSFLNLPFQGYFGPQTVSPPAGSWPCCSEPDPPLTPEPWQNITGGVILLLSSPLVPGEFCGEKMPSGAAAKCLLAPKGSSLAGSFLP